MLTEKPSCPYCNKTLPKTVKELKICPYCDMYMIKGGGKALSMPILPGPFREWITDKTEEDAPE